MKGQVPLVRAQSHNLQGCDFFAEQFELGRKKVWVGSGDIRLVSLVLKA